MTKKEVIILKGLPASGKSTWAREQLVKYPGKYKRINKDSLRDMLDGKKFSGKRESFIQDMRDALISRALNDGYSVIVDDTNLHPKHEARIRDLELVKELATVRVVEFEIDPKIAIKRDLLRSDSVGASVIMDMYRRFVLPAQCPPIEQHTWKRHAVVFDIDGTLAKMTERNPHDYSRVSEDVLNRNVAALFLRLATNPDLHIFIFSGRPESCREETEAWLKSHGIDAYKSLFMRPTGNDTKDWKVKRGLLEALAQEYYIEFVVDDRDQVVDMWRASGITCLQADYGNF